MSIFFKMIKSVEFSLIGGIVFLLFLTIVPEIPAWQSGDSAEIIAIESNEGNIDASALPRGPVPSLIFDLSSSTVSVCLGKVILNEFPFVVQDDSGTLISFAGEDAGTRRLARRIDRVHLYSARPLIDSSKLAIISEAVSSKSQDIQRYVPSEMILHFSDGRRLFVKTDAIGEAISQRKNIIWRVTEFFGSLFGSRSLTVTMHAEDAMSLYGLCRRGPDVEMR